MTDLPQKYNPADVEDKWYAYWLENKLFSSVPDAREAYTVVIPPPNVTGVLHMGHMLNNTIQDILVRRARMQGKNALWVPGTDHASISTETKVIGKLAAEGIKKTDLTREEFLSHAWEWTEKHGGIILQQLRKLGASCDWDRTAFTMDEKRSASVEKVFIDLFDNDKGGLEARRIARRRLGNKVMYLVPSYYPEKGKDPSDWGELETVKVINSASFLGVKSIPRL